MRNILVTGAAGMIGANFVRYLISDEFDYNVVGLDDLSGGYKEFLPKDKRFRFITADVCNTEALGYIFGSIKFDAVFHFAAYAAEGLSPFIRNFNYKNNVLGSVNVINECIKSDCKLIFTSSIAVYGDQFTPFTEEMIPQPIDPYGIAKYAVEMDIKQAHNQFGMRYNIIRPHNVVGLYQNIWDKYRNVIGIFINNTMHNRPILVYGDGEQTRAFSDIKYCMEPFRRMAHISDNTTYNIGSDTPYSLNSIATKVSNIAKKFGFISKIEHVEARHEAKHAICNHDKIKRDMRFNDETDIDSLITDMFSWAIVQKDREIKTMDYEIEKGMYDYWK